jgi:serine/threonine protein kinase
MAGTGSVTAENSAASGTTIVVQTARELLRVLREAQLLRREHLAEAEALARQSADSKDLARALYRRGWLTKFQLTMALYGQAAELDLGAYRLYDRIGTGGMGDVYRAVHRRLGRVAALKVVRPDLLVEPTVLSRFRREARAAGRLNHPHIVRV